MTLSLPPLEHNQKMYPGLLALLNLSLDELIKAGFILVEDNNVDGSFLLHHFVSSFLKDDHNVCIVGFSQTLVHYSSIGKKLGLNLNSAKENNQFSFVDGMNVFLKCLQEEDGSSSYPNESVDLKSLYNDVISIVEGMNKKPTLIIFDDISMLINAGLSAEEVADFMHYCYHMTKNTGNKLCLLALLHCDSDVQDDDAIYLRNQLKYYAKIQFAVKGLETGYSKDVHGEVELKHQKPEVLNIMSTETKLMQYKLNEKGVNFFPVGTSAAVL